MSVHRNPRMELHSSSDALQLDPASSHHHPPKPDLEDDVVASTSAAQSSQRDKIDSSSTSRDDASSISSSSDHDHNIPTIHPTRRDTLSKSYTTLEERTVLHKLDRRLTLFLALLYLLSFLDRSNIGNARVAGLQTSLNITGSQFDLALLAFYVTYISFEWMILLYRLVRPHIYITACVFAWGLVACLQASVRNFNQLLTLRAVLGVTEAAFGPGVPYYMTFFYRREELASRIGLQISAAPLATSFASSLAWVIVKVSGDGPIESWRALFLVEGFPSIVAAVFAFYLIPDSPATAPWLTLRERRVAVLRLRGDSVDGSSPLMTASSKQTPGATLRSRHLDTTEILRTLSDPKAYLVALMFFSVNVSFASLPVFLPTIINSMSFSPLTSQILAAPPYLVAFAFVIGVSRATDRVRDSRGVFLACCAGLSCVSYGAIASVGALEARGVVGESLSVLLRYVAVYGAAMGLFSSVVLIITWQLNNQASSTGKGVGMVILQVIGQCGPLVGVKLFPEEGAPYFVAGMAVCAGFMGTVAVLAVGLRWWLKRLNSTAAGHGSGGRGSKDGYEMASLQDRDGRELEADEAVEMERLVGGGDSGESDHDNQEEEDEGGGGVVHHGKINAVFRYML